MIASLALLTILLAGIVILISKRANKSTFREEKTNNLKQFFQYSVLFGLLIVVAVGFAGLLGRIFNRSTFVLADESALARYSAFVIVGLPLLLGIANWLRRQHQQNTKEKESLAWNFYLTVTSIVALIAWASALNQLLRWIFADEFISSQSFSVFIVWILIWVIHLRFAWKNADPQKIQLSFLLGSFIGAVVGIVAVSTILSTALRALMITRETKLIESNLNSLIYGLIYLSIAAIIWITYWIRFAITSEKTVLWFTYLIIVAIGGTLITAVSTLSTSVYQIIVWLIGEPVEKTFSSHFQNMPTLASVALTTLFVWWYHKSVLKEINVGKRNDVNRTYDYLIAAIGLVAATTGFTTVLVSLIESLAVASLITGGSAINTLLLALTLIAVGAPFWFIHWNRVQKLITYQDLDEQKSPVRRVYLFLLFGVSGIAAIVSAILVVYFVFEDSFSGGLSLETLRKLRFPLAILISTAVISGYHWLVFRVDRELDLADAIEPDNIYVISPLDKDLADWLKKNARGKSKVWIDLDSKAEPFDRAELFQLIKSSHSKTIFVINHNGKPQIINVGNE